MTESPVVLKKVRETKTNRGCLVVTTTRYDERQKFLIEDVELSCDMPLPMVAFSAERVFERAFR